MGENGICFFRQSFEFFVVRLQKLVSLGSGARGEGAPLLPPPAKRYYILTVYCVKITYYKNKVRSEPFARESDSHLTSFL